MLIWCENCRLKFFNLLTLATSRDIDRDEISSNWDWELKRCDLSAFCIITMTTRSFVVVCRFFFDTFSSYRFTISLDFSAFSSAEWDLSREASMMSSLDRSLSYQIVELCAIFRFARDRSLSCQIVELCAIVRFVQDRSLCFQIARFSAIVLFVLNRRYASLDNFSRGWSVSSDAMTKFETLSRNMFSCAENAELLIVWIDSSELIFTSICSVASNRLCKYCELQNNFSLTLRSCHQDEDEMLCSITSSQFVQNEISICIFFSVSLRRVTYLMFPRRTASRSISFSSSIKFASQVL